MPLVDESGIRTLLLVLFQCYGRRVPGAFLPLQNIRISVDVSYDVTHYREGHACMKTKTNIERTNIHIQKQYRKKASAV